MSGRLRLVLLALLAAAQLVTPLAMIARRERVLAEGEQFRFRAAPVDPADAFRGRFVALSIEESSVPLAPGVEIERGRRVYGHLERGEEGFARIVRMSLEPPPEGPYVAARASWQADRELHLDLPFDRFYLEEDLAPLAESAYRRLTRGEERRVWVEVRIDRDGFAVLEELYLAGVPVRRYLERQGGG